MKNRLFGILLATSLLLGVGPGTALASSLQSTIETAEQAFGGEAFSAEAIGRFADIEMLSGNQLISALYDAETGQLIDSEVYGSPRRLQKVSAALDRAVLSLVEAIEAAEGAVGPGEVLEAALLLGRRNGGRQFIVDIRTDEGIFDVIVNSITGQVVRIIRD